MLTTEASAQFVQALLAFPFLLMGISHIVQPTMWRQFFRYLHNLGSTGVIFRTFALELTPAIVLITFHQVWTGPAILISLYGWILMLKVSMSLLIPSLGLRSLAMANREASPDFTIAGVLLIALSLTCFWSFLD